MTAVRVFLVLEVKKGRAYTSWSLGLYEPRGIYKVSMLKQGSFQTSEKELESAEWYIRSVQDLRKSVGGQ